ncbi:hypothetical protein BDZ94DRAFT_823103 [Collybia nuda]|uniref:Uncharacterized protein n=1 Tax=Collybia nuda TaxID=64659 RepID=A0A9P5Y2W9_9AGAR|nr:hypothetical protein BDZ94DRAFT_823103 [Collybia nuda]
MTSATTITSSVPRLGTVTDDLFTVTSSPSRIGPVVSTITYLTRSGTSVGVAFDIFTLRPAPNSLTVFPTWSMSTSPPSETSAPIKFQSNKGAIVGGIVGACTLFIAAVIAFICIRRGWLSHQQKAHSHGKWYDLEGKDNRDVILRANATLDPSGNSKVPTMDHTLACVSQTENNTLPHGGPLKPLLTPDPFSDPRTLSARTGYVPSSSPVYDVVLEMNVIPKRERNSDQ